MEHERPTRPRWGVWVCDRRVVQKFLTIRLKQETTGRKPTLMQRTVMAIRDT